jgi:creatinine amidohydrolase
MRRCLSTLLLLPVLAHAQTYDLRRMTSTQVAALDRGKTVVLLTGGILEEHGPFLPVFSDGFMDERLTKDLASALVERGYAVLAFPSIPLGSGGANIIGEKYVFSGTFGVRSRTLQAVYMDLADEIGLQGFRRVFVISNHDAPNCNRVLDEAGEYFHDTYGGFMVNLNGLLALHGAGPVPSAEQAKEEGLSLHAGAGETSTALYLVPSLVQEGYRQAPAQAGSDFAALRTIAARSGWPGYFGSPRLATASRGAARWNALSAKAVEVAVQILNGADPQAMPHYVEATQRDASSREVDARQLRHEDEAQLRQETWLKKHSRPQP